jgi:hypothetical protein
MIEIIFFTTNSIITLTLLNEYFRLKYPAEYLNFWINIVYYFILVASKFQYSINKYLVKYLAEPISFYRDIVKQYKIEVILNNEIIYTSVDLCAFATNSGFQEPKNTQEEKPFDFIIYTDIHKNKKIFYHFPDKDELVCEAVDYKFVLIDITSGDSTIKIDLKTDSGNYYLANNVFHTSFIRYLLKNDYNHELSPKYSIMILDQNVICVEFDNQNVIKLNKDNYEKQMILENNIKN